LHFNTDGGDAAAFRMTHFACEDNKSSMFWRFMKKPLLFSPAIAGDNTLPVVQQGKDVKGRFSFFGNPIANER
jgi:hypothetical protein